MYGSSSCRCLASLPTRSFASGKFDEISAVLALQRPDGHIQLDFPAEDAIDLQTPRLDAPESTNQPPTRTHDIDSKKQRTAKLDVDLVSVPPLMSICILIAATFSRSWLLRNDCNAMATAFVSPLTPSTETLS
ncbi:hypothetical protein PF010_g30457 [Phytophthora fragariae]|uniref:Uncharacterized protein n=1 Tax=Phytophthora fragariae TaxID=53985 RepID=A0A6A4BIY5_9STRA|nr:hypothetical protein PF003_g7459 [Phytophthora fragariae]KAE8921432.1 hypothetical protein PF009_g28290 [Phytophthora fragariae]KAE8959358.1 hypothetical protein PF011_g30461 [Phytophthora fragariae]KAE9059846.1 hypothetical protein PF010_g30457 [Phytophthora fragariae]KAE9165597.1 hypothetical protein PF004_g29443 [Phytophthora fragariae]